MAKIENKLGNKTANPPKPPKTADRTTGTPEPPRGSDDDDEDGDIATPKRDRYGTDDEPL